MKTSELKQLIREEIKALLKEATSTTDAKTIKANLKSKKDGIYILMGGADEDGWNEETLDKGKPLYYTTDFRDPKLKSLPKDGMVKVDIDKGVMDVSSY